VSYRMNFYSGVTSHFEPKVEIETRSVYDTNNIVATLIVGEFQFPLTKVMAEQLHTEVGTVLAGILYPLPDV
jgi:hypothetical protein